MPLSLFRDEKAGGTVARKSEDLPTQSSGSPRETEAAEFMLSETSTRARFPLRGMRVAVRKHR